MELRLNLVGYMYTQSTGRLGFVLSTWRSCTQTASGIHGNAILARKSITINALENIKISRNSSAW